MRPGGPSPGSNRSLNYVPSRSPSRQRPYGPPGAAAPRQQHLPRSSSAARKPPEPLRRAVADCLSASSGPQLYGGAHSSEAARILRDYIANPSTIDMAYNVLIEHTIAERDRSPAVVPRCVTLLKRYLLRYVPKVQTMRQIDNFCEISMAECKSVISQGDSLWPKLLSQHSASSVGVPSPFTSSFPTSNFASASLVKSLNYVRSLVARHIPKLSFQPIANYGSSSSSRQSLPTLSSLLSSSFTSHVSPDIVKSRISPEKKDGSSITVPDSSPIEIIDGITGCKYIFLDLFAWRWLQEREQRSPLAEESGLSWPQVAGPPGFLEVGAATLLVGNMEPKPNTTKQTWKYHVAHDLPDVDQLLQPSFTGQASNFESAENHLKVITASKRLKPGPHEVWMTVPVSTFRSRARPLFQYRHYSEQQPLKLNPAEVSEVIAEVCSGSSEKPNLTSVPSRLTNHNKRPSTDVAVSVLIKLVIDMYMADYATAAPLTIFMLEDMLSSPKVASRSRAFDVLLNLAVHAHLLEPILSEDQPLTEDESSQGSLLDNKKQSATLEQINPESSLQHGMPSAIDKFESWILMILFEILHFLVQAEEREEIVWASALSCLLYFICDRGKIRRSRLEGLDIRVIKILLDISREHSWADVVHHKLICMLTNLFYQASDGSPKLISDTSAFFMEKVDLIGGIDVICFEYLPANSRQEKGNLFAVLFDYVLHKINEGCRASGASDYIYDEIQPVASLLALADAPEAFYIAVKHGMEGIGAVLKGSVTSSLPRSQNVKRLEVLLDRVTGSLDATISAFTCLDSEFSYMFRLTKSYKFLSSIEEGLGNSEIALKARLSWATLHSLLHSERSAYRHHAYTWLVELLLSDISEGGDRSIFFNIKKLQKYIGDAGNQDLTCSSVPLSICMMCGLLKSRHNYIRRGFLFTLEKLLMRCKLLLHEGELQLGSENSGSLEPDGNRLDIAYAVIDIMSCALSLVVQINETDHTNILKMCDLLFSQLCLRQSSNRAPRGDLKCIGRLSCQSIESLNNDSAPTTPLGHTTKDKYLKDELPGKVTAGSGSFHPTTVSETAFTAALLLTGHAKVPMQLVAHVPPSLFYWPLIQLAGAATDDIALGVAVGSKGMGNLPGATSDIRAALLLLLICKCSADPAAFSEVEGEEFFRGLLDDMDSRVAYYSSAFLLKRVMTEEPDKYQWILQSLIFKAQQSNNEKLLENPYLQMRGIIQLSNDLGV